MIESIIFFLLVSLACLYLLNLYVGFRLAHRDFSAAYNDARKLWPARGIYTAGVAENSITSVRQAFDAGATGVEIDIFYDVEMADFIVSHDRPYRLVEGKLLTLKEMFDALGEEHYFWLDFKKLRKLTRSQAIQAVSRLAEITTQHGLRERVYVEGETPINLALFRRAGFHTIFDTHPTADGKLLTPAVIAIYKMVYYFGKHTVMAMESGSREKPIYGPATSASLGQVPMFLYHVPQDDPGWQQALIAQPAVRVLVMGSERYANPGNGPENGDGGTLT